MKRRVITQDEWQSLAVLVIENAGQELSELRDKVLARTKRYQLSVCGLFGIGEVAYVGGYDTRVEAERMYDGVAAQISADDLTSLVLVDTKLGRILKQSIS